MEVNSIILISLLSLLVSYLITASIVIWREEGIWRLPIGKRFIVNTFCKIREFCLQISSCQICCFSESVYGYENTIQFTTHDMENKKVEKINDVNSDIEINIVVDSVIIDVAPISIQRISKPVVQPKLGKLSESLKSENCSYSVDSKNSYLDIRTCVPFENDEITPLSQISQVASVTLSQFKNSINYGRKCILPLNFWQTTAVFSERHSLLARSWDESFLNDRTSYSTFSIPTVV